MKTAALSILLFLVSSQASAYCFEDAGRRFNVNVPLLKAVCFTESSLKADAINSGNSDGSTDYGLCQINSWWLPKLEPYGITKESLINDPCENALVSAWILAQNFESTSDGWEAVGAYNAGFSNSPKKKKAREVYIALVKKNLEAMK